VKMAAAEEAVSRQTEALLKSQGVMWNNVSGELDSYMKQLEDLTAYNDTDLQQAFNTMIAAGMSYTEAIESMNTVTSMSFSLNRDLASMALLVGKAYNGQTGELSRYGIVLDESLDKTEKFAGLQKYVGDNFADASERADTFEGNMDSLRHETSNFLEAMGDPLLDPLSKFIGLLAEGSEESTLFATKLGKIIAAPFEVVVNTKEIEKLGVELHELEMIKSRTWEEDKRRSEVIFEMQQKINGVYEERNGFIKTGIDIESQIAAEEDITYLIQLKKMGASENFLKTLRAELEIQNQINGAVQTELTMRERAAAAQKNVEQSQRSVLRNIGGTSSMSAGTAALIKKTYDRDVDPKRINPNITSSTRSGV